MKLEGKVAFVTGGASGLGYETVKVLVENGVKVGIADVNEDKGMEAEELLGTENVIFITTDVTDEQQVKEAIQKTVDKFGALHITLNSAGVALVSQTLKKDKILDFNIHRAVMDINVNGTIYSAAYSAQQMAKNEEVNERGEKGVIINVSSLMGSQGSKGLASYGASKGAILGLTLPMARDLGKFGIRVLNIAPSFFRTPIVATGGIEDVSRVEKYTPLNRVGE